jgi:hypothetical protein
MKGRVAGFNEDRVETSLSNTDSIFDLSQQLVPDEGLAANKSRNNSFTGQFRPLVGVYEFSNFLRIRMIQICMERPDRELSVDVPYA